MNVEERLKGFRLRATADVLRPSVLAAARRTGRERRLWRWTWVAAAVVFAVVIPVNRSLDVPRPPGPPAASSDPEEGLRLRWRWAATPKASIFPREEIR